MTFSRAALVPTLLLLTTLSGCKTFGSAKGPYRDVLPGPDRLAQKVFYASGGKSWHTVSRIKFTFNVIDDGKTVLSRSHDWDLVAGTNTVTTADNSTTLYLNTPPSTPAEKSAFAAWTNDTYWLLMPLKLFDPGVNRLMLVPETIGPKQYEVLQLTFGDVGLTPGDTYNLYIEPTLARVKYWDYIPNPDKKLRFSWDDYETFGPLTLATSHSLVGGTRQITLTNISVETR